MYVFCMLKFFAMHVVDHSGEGCRFGERMDFCQKSDPPEIRWIPERGFLKRVAFGRRDAKRIFEMVSRIGDFFFGEWEGGKGGMHACMHAFLVYASSDPHFCCKSLLETARRHSAASWAPHAHTKQTVRNLLCIFSEPLRKRQRNRSQRKKGSESSPHPHC